MMRCIVTWSNPDEQRFGTVTEYIIAEKMVVEFDDEEDIEYHFLCDVSASSPGARHSEKWYGPRRGESNAMESVEIKVDEFFLPNTIWHDKRRQQLFDEIRPVRGLVAKHWHELLDNEILSIDAESHCGRLIVQRVTELDAYIAKFQFATGDEIADKLRDVIVTECNTIYFG